MNNLKAIIVDDEEDSIRMLQLQLQANCPSVEVLDTFTQPAKALSVIENLKPDILFLDIEMPLMNGFELVEKLMDKQVHPNVVFVTAYNQYALKAFKFNAVSYLVKPVDSEELIAVVDKIKDYHKPTREQMGFLQQQLQGVVPTKIAIPSATGAVFINLDEIIYVESCNNYCKILLTQNRNYLLSKSMKEVQDILEESHFLRIHRQYIINLNHVKQLNKNDAIIVLDTGENLPISRSQKDIFAEKYKWL